MPGRQQQHTDWKTITVKPLHPTFGAEILGADFDNMSEAQLEEIKAAMAIYGVLLFRSTPLTDSTHVQFSRHLGPLDTITRYLSPTRKLRYTHHELFDAGNIDDATGLPIPPTSPRAHYNKGNTLFHVDSSFNPRRASWSLLRAVELPPPGTGGETEFADARTAFDELDPVLKEELLEKQYIGAHTLLQSRKLGSPSYFADLDPTSQPMSLHSLVQPHTPSGRTTIYAGAHCHHIVGLSDSESNTLLAKLRDHITQPKYVLSISWLNSGDMVAWDNTSVQHRATGGTFEGKWKRDMRRTTVHDGSSAAWGFNAGQEARGFGLGT